VVAKKCGCKDKYTRKVTFTFIDAYHRPCLIKKDIILAELDLMRETFDILDEIDKKAHGIRESRIEVDHFVDQSNIVVKQIYNCSKKPYWQSSYSLSKSPVLTRLNTEI
jgi:hypothetical protein